MRDKIKAGFTLIELLVVIGIIVIISSLVIINVTQARMNGRDAKRISDLKSIQNALEMYYEKNKKYPIACTGAGCTTEVTVSSVHTGTTYWNNYAQSDLDAEWITASTGLGSFLSSYISPLPKDPMNGKMGIKVVAPASANCSDRGVFSLGALRPMAYMYRSDATGDNYIILTFMEVRCEGLDENDGGGRNSMYELWGGKDGNTL